MTDRRQDAYAVRLEAAELARSRDHETHKANGDEQRYAGAKYFMSFTKGLPHNEQTGLLEDPQDFVAFRRAIDDGFIEPFTERIRHGARYKVVPETNNNNFRIEDVLRPGIVEAAQKRVDETEEGSTERQDAEKALATAQKDIADAGKLRKWEAPTAGLAFDLEGPDAQAVTMQPAPPLMKEPGMVNPELAFEMAEVYELAILRDVSLNDFEEAQDATHPLTESINRLNKLSYISKESDTCCQMFGRPRKLSTKEDSRGKLDCQTVFRGSSPGVEIGPYLSQFLLIGNTDVNQNADGIGGGSIAEGKITYGVLQIDQKVPIAQPQRDYMVTMADYVAVQRGIGQTRETYSAQKDTAPSTTPCPPRPPRRFISTPRDLATYVHYDALYEAYLNACIILLGMGTPFDPGFAQLSGGNTFIGGQTVARNAGGFALYGGPHILNLVTEVATRALKAVRFQKFNSHIRLRPEALAARLELLRRSDENAQKTLPPELVSDIKKLSEGFEKTLEQIKDGTNKDSKNGIGQGTYFLPMAFPEGSPMHPAYGAGHATVAGACVTILKAFFDTSTVLAKPQEGSIAFKSAGEGDTPVVFRAPDLPNPATGEGESGNMLVESPINAFLTLEGELNKLAANISIGRNMAGVHFFSDYYDSLRMGEEIAIGMLEEQALTYPTDPFVLSLPTFDGDVVRIGNR